MVVRERLDLLVLLERGECQDSVAHQEDPEVRELRERTETPDLGARGDRPEQWERQDVQVPPDAPVRRVK